MVYNKSVNLDLTFEPEILIGMVKLGQFSTP